MRRNRTRAGEIQLPPTAKRGPRSGSQFAPGMFELAVNPQLDAAHGKQEQPSFRSSRPDEVADPELPVPDARGFRLGQPVFYALMVHGESPARPPMRMKLKSSTVG